MSYYWRSYLWASAAIDLTTWGTRGPDTFGSTTLTYLANEVAIHLRRAERYTLCLYSAYVDRNTKRVEAFRTRARDAAEAITAAVRLRHPGLDFTPQIFQYNRACTILRLLPADEWHPAREETGAEPLAIQCDSSWKSIDQTRAGITWSHDTEIRINLSPAAPASNVQAEFLALALATLTQVRDRTPLDITADQKEAVRAVSLLSKGIMPPWMYTESSDLAQRIVIAAMTSMRLRPVTIRWAKRTQVFRADKIAAWDGPLTDILAPTTWAKRQGMPLTWVDKDRGL